MFVSFAIDGGNTRYGTVCFPEWGVGDGEQDTGDRKVYWSDSVLAFREPRMVLKRNRGDASARLWLTLLRPGTLRGQHRLTNEGCQCERVICHYGCEPECTTADHKWRRRDPERTGVCPLLAQENNFERGDDSYDQGGMDTFLDELTKQQMEDGVNEEELMGWDRMEIDRYRRAVKLRDKMAACENEEERERVRLARRGDEGAEGADEDDVMAKYFEQYLGDETGGSKKWGESRRQKAAARRKEEEESEERELQEILRRTAKEKEQRRAGRSLRAARAVNPTFRRTKIARPQSRPHQVALRSFLTKEDTQTPELPGLSLPARQFPLLSSAFVMNVFLFVLYLTESLPPSSCPPRLRPLSSRTVSHGIHVNLSESNSKEERTCVRLRGSTTSLAAVNASPLFPNGCTRPT